MRNKDRYAHFRVGHVVGVEDYERESIQWVVIKVTKKGMSLKGVDGGFVATHPWDGFRTDLVLVLDGLERILEKL